MPRRHIGERTAGTRVTGTRASNIAAIDCGTNSTRLLVADGHGSTLSRELRLTRLGEGVDATHTLAAAAIERTVAVLRAYRKQMDEFGVAAARVVATSAVRDASNGRDFLDRATEATRTPVELLSGTQEGRLAYSGAVSDLDDGAGPFVVLDIGGGSTELTAVPAGEHDPRVVSLDLGCIRLTERYLHHDPPLPTEVDEATRAVGQALDRAVRALPLLDDELQAATLVGLAGTVTTISMLAHGWTAYDWGLVHHSELDLAAVEAWTGTLAGETVAARAARPGMVDGREDVIVGGVLVMREVMRRFGFTRCVVSESDILDGLVASIALPAADGAPPVTGQ
ncbi:MAG TPA: Ppx/GppA phosphatase family protein [Acidimicrobiales bacterium]|nr:Ppx/GppA phosphatase family protein [Acidimicrobiales bacterium]